MYSVAQVSPTTGGCPASGSTICAPASRVAGRRSQARPARLRAVEARQAGRAVAGTRRGARAGRAGTSSAPRCRPRCSATHFDLHGGGMDLKFPHHENEIAQSCAACDAPFVNVWMHNGFVQYRRREDVEVDSAISSRCAMCSRPARSGSAAVFPAQQPLPRADQLLRRRSLPQADETLLGSTGRSRASRCPAVRALARIAGGAGVVRRGDGR